MFHTYIYDNYKTYTDSCVPTSTICSWTTIMTCYQTVLMKCSRPTNSSTYTTQATVINATLSFHKLIPKNAQMTTLYTNLSLYITFTMIYYIRQELFGKCFSSLSYIKRISGLFIANALWTHWHVLSKM